MAGKKEIQAGQVDETLIFTVDELCEICQVQTEFVVEMVQYGIIQPKGNNVHNWQFTINQLLRLRKALRLQHDLELNYSGVALTLELLEQMESLRLQLDSMQRHLQLLHIDFK